MSRKAQSSMTAEERRFGLLLVCVFALIGLGPVIYGGPVRYWSIALSCLALVVSLFAPIWLKWPYRGWMWIGNVLHHIISPLVMGLLFFCVFTPAGLILRSFGAVPLALRRDKEAKTYWIERKQPAPTKDSMKFGF